MSDAITSALAVSVARYAYKYRAEKIKFQPGALNRILFAVQGRSYKDAPALASHIIKLFEAEKLTRWRFPHLYEDWRPWTKRPTDLIHPNQVYP